MYERGEPPPIHGGGMTAAEFNLLDNEIGGNYRHAWQNPRKRDWVTITELGLGYID